MSIQLCLLVPENAHELFQLILKNKIYLEQWFEWARQVKSESDILNFISTSRCYELGIWVDGSLIGGAGFHEINWDHLSVEIGGWVAEEYQQKGIAKKSMQALMAYAFLEYKLNRVEGLTRVDNQQARALVEDLGFAFEGIQREGQRLGGQFYDVACYSFLARDFHVTGDEACVQLAKQIPHCSH